MPFLIHNNQYSNYLTKITKIQYFLDQIAHISAYDKAKIGHESSLKSSDSAFSDGLTSFQNCFMLALVTVQFSPCPPCNSFSRIFHKLINALTRNPTNQNTLELQRLIKDYGNVLANLQYRVAGWEGHGHLVYYKYCVASMERVLDVGTVFGETWSRSCEVYLSDVERYLQDRRPSRRRQRDFKVAVEILNEIHKQIAVKAEVMEED